MSLPIPLMVRLRTARADRHVTADARDLVMRWTDPGGYASCTVPLDRPLSLQPDEVDYFAALTVYDGRTGGIVWDGRLEDPGRSAGRDGQVWDLVGVGGQAHTRDESRPAAYVDTSLQSLQRIDNIYPAGQDSITSDPGDLSTFRQALMLRFPQGSTVQADYRIAMRHSGFTQAGQKIARVTFSWDAGITSAALAVQAIMTTAGSGTANTAVNVTASTAGGSAAAVLGTHFAVGRDRVDVRFLNISVVGTVSQETWWMSVYNLAVRAMLKDKLGNDISLPTSYTTSTVLASEVVADLLGRVLNQYDGPASTVTTTTHGITQLAYPDGVTAERILQDLMALESGYTWRVWERLPTTGRFRFEWVPVPSVVRYEADAADGYDSQGSSDGLYNAVAVRWRDAAGTVQTTIRTSSVPALSAAGVTRQGSLDLGSDVGSLSDAQRAGDQWLAQRQYAPNGGRLTIARPILDLQTHRMVQPWEIRPGLIRVRGILPRPDALNRSTRDGVTIFRIVSSECRVSDATATLELDSYARTIPRMVAELMRSAPSTRRR